ncbi:MAG: hypothetical protein E7268_03270 [Lachnospiraceae bacterium]|nr:hypothetical protein [Lachnospiraceae bacterium]
MGIGLSGMVSGLDTDTLIKQLMSAERTRVTKVENKITKNEWLTEKWKDLNTKIYSLYTGSLSKMRTQGNYLTKKTTSSNESVVKATAGASAPIGTHYVTVDSVASAQYVTGGTFASDEKLTAKSKLVDAGVAAGTKINIACGDKTAELVVDENTTFNNLSDACKSAGLNVNFDEARQCLYISSRQSGKENAFSITTDAENAGSAAARKDIYEAVGYSNMSDADKATLNDALAALEASKSADINAILAKAESGTALTADEKKINDAYQLLVKKTEEQAEKTAAKKAQDTVDAGIVTQLTDAIKNNAATTIYEKEFTAEQITALKEKADKAAEKMYEESFKKFCEKTENADKFKNVTYADAVKLQEKKAAAEADPTAEQLTEAEEEIVAALNQVQAEVDEDALQACIEEEVKNYNTTDAAKKAVTDGKAAIVETEKANAKAALATDIADYADIDRFRADGNALSAIGLGNIDGTAISSGAGVGGMTVFEASDAKVTVNGAVIESSSNTISVNGLNLDLVSAKPGETISIGVSQDTDSVYNMVKDFVKQYNEVLEELNNAYYAESARGYEPLTDEQKDAMSDTEVEKWEKKIKDSLLRRDNTIGSLLNAMRTALDGCVTVDGEDYALSSFGICTTKYTEKGKLHIYGDQDDPDGMMYEDKLRKAIEEDPDKVMEVLQTLSKNLYDTMADKMKASELSSALTFYNDKQITKELTGYKDQLKKEEDRLTEIEDRYYKQFASMETALSKLSSQSSSLMSMLGMGQY